MLSKKTAPRPHWLHFAEVLSLGACVVGAIAAIALEQVTYAIAPIVLYLGLSRANQNRLHRSHRRDLRGLQSDVQQLVHQQHQLSIHLHTLSAQAQAEQIAELEARTQALLRAISPAIAQIEQFNQQATHLMSEAPLVPSSAPDPLSGDVSPKVWQAIAEVQNDLKTLVMPMMSQMNQTGERLEPLESQQQEIILRLIPNLAAALKELGQQAGKISILEAAITQLAVEIDRVRSRRSR